MKKISLTLITMLLATAGVMAQAQFGLKAGFNVATIDNKFHPVDGNELWRPGLNIGLASQFRIGEVFSIAPELIYAQRGFKEEYPTLITGVREARFDYLSLPVLFRRQFGNVLKGYVNAGPVLSYWLGGKQSVYGTLTNSSGMDAPYEESITFKGERNAEYDYGEVNRLEIGASVGGGIKLDTEAGSFLIDLRYTHGFTKIVNYLAWGPRKVKNQAVGVSLIYLVPSVR